ncbi:glycosyltransferase family 2 protein [Zophobihabitans entericus]|uniref:Glycosyltransferase family 2 protein n=1 Tax=Zophobihabitans entericus TaxID=1635327 RepID=A0A6G9I9K6_9GAMM|nr:glycosyltransferase family 2 protein [Zophobihabitans entericus]QIQ20260.1 glycosyltransferase family 2 protein [Zophobihabitans entericus]
MENKISAVIITLNEEKNIGRCLASLQGIADEIIIVDSFSTDKTEEICQQYGAKFIRQAWLGYGKQKNFAAEQAQYDYILSLDADEALSDELKASILQLKSQSMSEAYSLNRLTNYCGKWIRHCGWYPDRKIRLWKKGCANWTTPRVHETIKLAPNITPIHLKGDLLHYTYYTIGEHIQIANKYTTLVAEEYADRGRKASFIKIFLNPPFSFFRDYFLRLGILDGYYGFVICAVASFSTFLKYSKLKQVLEQRKLEQRKHDA